MSTIVHPVKLTAYVLEAPTTDGMKMSFSTLDMRSMFLVALEDESGITGYGESWVNFPSWASSERFETYANGIVPVLKSKPMSSVAGYRQCLEEDLVPLGRQWGAPGPISQAISGVDMALWDLISKRRERTLGEMLAVSPLDSVPVYASSISDSDPSHLIGEWISRGYTAIKAKVGFERDSDIKFMEGLRSSVGDDIALFADANQAWTVEEAIQMAPILRDVGIEWIEEPIRGNALDDIEAFHRVSAFPVATGENLYGVDTFVRYARSPAVHVLQPDVSKVGGISAFLDIVGLIGADVIVAPHVFSGAPTLAASIHLAASLANVSLVEYEARSNPFRDRLFGEPAPALAGGRVSVPVGPGIGTEIDWSSLDQFIANSAVWQL